MTESPHSDTKRKISREIQGILVGAVGVLVLASLASYSVDDHSFDSYSTSTEVHNLVGRFGAQLSDLLLQLFGLASWLIPFTLVFIAQALVRNREIRWKWYKGIAFATLLVSLSVLFSFFIQRTLLFGVEFPTGGGVGTLLASALREILGPFGAMTVILSCIAASIMVLSRFSFALFAAWWVEHLMGRWEGWFEKRRLSRELAAREKGESLPASEPKIVVRPAPMPDPPKKVHKEKKKEEEKSLPIQETFDFVSSDGFYQTPPLSLLDQPAGGRRKIDREALQMNARLLEKKLLDFGIDGEVVEIVPGPVVTMYEFAPGPGIKLSRIAGLADDLTMALQATAVRIVAPIPGKGVVGIELPNREREMVSLREILSCEAFHKGRFRLPLALGKDIAGEPLVTDLARMPHLLVAGATGAGKSVSINTMVLSLLYTYTPNDVRLIMVDPKMLELSIYEGIPHLLLPVVTNPKKASLALRWAVEEMGRRYRLMADKGVRNIESYNRQLQQEAEGKGGTPPAEPPPDEMAGSSDGDEDAIREFLEKREELDHGHLPYIVVIVDELADLMMVAGREIEESIARLAQMARAAGIHLILATQRPSVDVITGLIKANFPARISFQVSSKIDSRTILDTNGAEALLGMGDMLFLPPGTAKLMRAHGAFVSDAEVQRVVDFLKRQGKPVYDKRILEMKESDEKGGDQEDDLDDPQYDAAVAIVAETRQASISMIQRRLRIGYNRAARIIERMEQEGIVGPSDGTSKPREVYINKL